MSEDELFDDLKKDTKGIVDDDPNDTRPIINLKANEQTKNIDDLEKYSQTMDQPVYQRDGRLVTIGYS
jgi:hypothetical protein